MKTRIDSITQARRVVCLAITFLASSHFLSAQVLEGLVAYYPFDEDNAIDATGNGHDGVVNGATWSAEGPMGGSFIFDGNDDYIRIADHPELNPEDFTVTHWVKLSQPTSVGGSFAKARALTTEFYRVLWLDSSVHYSVRLYVGGDPYRASLAAPFDPYYEGWTMVTVVSTKLPTGINLYQNRMYVNDRLVAQTPIGHGGPTVSNDDILIGAGEFDEDGETPLQHFQGQIDEVRFYDRALSPEEISTLYRNVADAGLPPVITDGPDSVEVEVGETVQLSVQAAGGLPLAYQWRFNGTNLVAGTDSMLVLTNAQLADAGLYSVTVSNTFGIATSSNALLTVSEGPGSGLVAYYPFDDGTADDAGGNGHDGLVHDAMWSPLGASGGSFVFEGNDELWGANDFIFLPDHPDLNPEVFTLTHWVKVPQNGAPKASFGNTGGSSVYRVLFHGLNVHFSISVNGDGSGSLDAPFSPYFDQWTMVTVTYNGTKTRMYVNDQLVAEGDLSAGSMANSGYILIGAGGPGEPGWPSDLFPGQIDEVRLYDRELSPGEITALYYTVIGGVIPPVITDEPDSVEAEVGDTVQFEVQATGDEPLTYQWRLDGVNISSSNNSTLVLTNVQLSEAGMYSVVVNNNFGSDVSTNATLTVAPKPASQVVVTSVAGSSGTSVPVPIQLVSLGTENALGFSVEFDSATVVVEDVILGSDATGAALLVNRSQTNVGRLGVAIVLGGNEVFPPGSNEIVVVVFSSAPTPNDLVVPIIFADQPTIREVLDPLAASLLAIYVDGTLSLGESYYEGDVAPRGNVDRNLSVGDWLQSGRFVAALDTPAVGGEFQRADDAPRATLGDGRISVIDWVQTGRYVVGLDPLTIAGGPDAPVQPAPISAQNGDDTRIVSVIESVLVAGTTNVVSVRLESQGDESALGFSLLFDPACLTYTGVSRGIDASGATLNVNPNSIASGELGIALSLPIGTVFDVGTNELIHVGFSVVETASQNKAIAFSDSPILRETSDALANPLPTDYQAGTLAVIPVPLLSIAQDGETITLSWLTNFADFTLESAGGLGDSTWEPVGESVLTNEGSMSVTVPITNVQTVYRLRKQ